jgi:hypothetical protein
VIARTAKNFALRRPGLVGDSAHGSAGAIEAFKISVQKIGSVSSKRRVGSRVQFSLIHSVSGLTSGGSA